MKYEVRVSYKRSHLVYVVVRKGDGFVVDKTLDPLGRPYTSFAYEFKPEEIGALTEVLADQNIRKVELIPVR